MTSFVTATTGSAATTIDTVTAAVMDRFNRAFVDHDPTLLDDLVAEDCVMVAARPAPEGERVEGREDCLAFWRTLASDPSSRFRPDEVVVAGDRATIFWRYTFGPGPLDHVLGVNLMRLDENGLIVEALGYSKTGGEVPLATDADAGSGTSTDARAHAGTASNGA
ncbi:nuclear transport factor 2 family protein [Streptomyces sp. NPDC051921]|uniref:nuclear transport factor 2 family protein n=1 Tax=Streptomyces sp. NPDC051921 TaxID=3155806 RepID=UPI00343BC1D5